MDRVKILGVATSTRSRGNLSELKEIIAKTKNREDLEYTIETLARNKVISNTEACLVASLQGAASEGAQIDIVRANKFFPKGYPQDITKDKEKKLVDLIKKHDGIIIATPVYFGDRSSYAANFIRLLKEHNLLRDKVVGVVSAGAKRNGGQETTNIYTLWETLEGGAYVCGNGPKTSQYGGTAWAGDIGSIGNDDFGIDTSIGVGHRVSQVTEILKNADSGKLDDFKISFWITKDRDHTLEKNISTQVEKLKKVFPARFKFEVLDLTGISLLRCVGCSICPFHYDKSKKDVAIKCKIQNDDMKNIYASLVNNDAIVICGYNPKSTQGLMDIYQTFLERTRFIRRDNFLLTNVPITSYSMKGPEQEDLFSLKVMTSFMRHNTIICPPIKHTISGKSPEHSFEGLVDFINKAVLVRKGRNVVKARQVSYHVIGYGIKDADDIENMRK